MRFASNFGGARTKHARFDSQRTGRSDFAGGGGGKRTAPRLSRERSAQAQQKRVGFGGGFLLHPVPDVRQQGDLPQLGHARRHQLAELASGRSADDDVLVGRQKRG